jgi:tRNA-binding protein
MEENNNEPLSWSEFSRVDMRVGTIIKAEIFEEARKPAYKIQVDFGPLGIRKTSAQVTDFYACEDLVGKQVIGVVNFPPKQIATIKSEFLLLGAIGGTGEVTVLQTERQVENGLRIG